MNLKKITHTDRIGKEFIKYVLEIGERLFPIQILSGSYSRDALKIKKEEEAIVIKGELKFK